MIRARRLQRSFLLLAIVATLLMILAPVVSRALQSAGTDSGAIPMHQHDHSAMQMQMAPSAHTGHAGHEQSTATQHAGDAALVATGLSSPNPDEHAAHGEACDYCTMASRLLPWLALLLMLSSLWCRWLAIVAPHASVLPAMHWPAHAARGPPRDL